MDRYAVQVRGNLSPDEMRTAAKLFVGIHDFKAYCASGSSVKTTVREIYSVEIYEENGLINIEVCGGGFLYNMVRTMSGTIIDYAAGRLSLQDIKNSLERRDRSSVGKTMPAKGLTLVGVDYGCDLFAKR